MQSTRARSHCDQDRGLTIEKHLSIRQSLRDGRAPTQIDGLIRLENIQRNRRDFARRYRAIAAREGVPHVSKHRRTGRKGAP
jgi:hypothetical protein